MDTVSLRHGCCYDRVFSWKNNEPNVADARYVAWDRRDGGMVDMMHTRELPAICQSPLGTPHSFRTRYYINVHAGVLLLFVHVSVIIVLF